VERTLASTSLSSHAALRRSLVRWLHSAYEAGLDGESVLALFLGSCAVCVVSGSSSA